MKYLVAQQINSNLFSLTGEVTETTTDNKKTTYTFTLNINDAELTELQSQVLNLKSYNLHQYQF